MLPAQKVVELKPVVKKRTKNTVLNAVKNKVMNNPILTLVSLGLVVCCAPSMAAEFDLPTVTMAGVTSSSSATEIITAVIKYAVKMLLWIFVVIAGVGFIKNTVKSVHKVRRDEDGKWGDVVGEITGNALIVIVAILLAAWVTNILN
jgi:hypothetical protein